MNKLTFERIAFVVVAVVLFLAVVVGTVMVIICPEILALAAILVFVCAFFWFAYRRVKKDMLEAVRSQREEER